MVEIERIITDEVGERYSEVWIGGKFAGVVYAERGGSTWTFSADDQEWVYLEEVQARSSYRAACDEIRSLHSARNA